MLQKVLSNQPHNYLTATIEYALFFFSPTFDSYSLFFFPFFRQEERQRQKESNLAHREAKHAARDRYNIRSAGFRSDLMVAMGDHAYLMLVPQQECLCWGHCLIVPIESVNSMTLCDERVWEEVRGFQTSLERMCAAGPRASDAGEPIGIVYLETVPTVSRPHHTVIHAVPMELDVHEDLPIYFKKALSEVGSDWSTHKKIVDTHATKTIRQAIPPNFPYFHAEWAGGRYPRGGMAHVIEDIRTFPKNFGLDILRGLLGQVPTAFGRRSHLNRGRSGRGHNSHSHAERANEAKKMVIEFMRCFGPYDSTRTGGNAANVVGHGS